MQKLRTLAASHMLRDRVTELFIASIATGVRRAMTPIMAYYSACNLPDHTWERFDFSAHNRLIRFDADIPCAICGIFHRSPAGRDFSNYGFFDRAEQIADFDRAGRCSMTPDYSHLIDLEDVPNITLAYQTEHVEVLRALLKVIESVPVTLSTTELQKQVSATKLMPKSNLAARIWCLRILAELGVVTNAKVPKYSGAFHFYSYLQRIEMENEAFSQMPHRADPVWPLSAGRGQPAVNWSLAHQIFPQLAA
ncbi:hypothetical protein [Ottowia thiooxydans]|uniref:hypothetical protein n=1 Tax=Ottowia thiooxydans TaxID=219182 RepID=UPI0012EB216C|nr:hypothetical protein [Ottowia thiooxydans]